jgi:homoserine kinase
MTKIHVRAPATTANLGPGFDIAGAAFDLWNEVEVEDSPNGGVDREHLAVRAFAKFAEPEAYSFTFTDRIPRERGLGSSAAVVALGLVAGALAAGLDLTADELLDAGLELEGHADNLAAALAGGVCLTWEGHIARIADDVPAAPIAVIPKNRVNTAESRALLPQTVAHADAVFTAGRAALLGAALARGDDSLFAAGADDRLHEPYRVEHAPHLQEIRGQLPDGALGATLSGSGPTVIVWARKQAAAAVAAELERRFPEHDVLQLEIAKGGAGPV